MRRIFKLLNCDRVRWVSTVAKAVNANLENKGLWIHAQAEQL